MILLLEGCDCSGKSTFVEALKNEWGWCHHGVYKTPTLAFQAYEALTESLLVNPEQNMLIDRLHISERIYGKVYHNEWMSDDRYNFIEYKLKLLETVVVLFKPHLKTVLKEWQKRKNEEMVKSEKQIEEIYHAYSSIYAYTKLPVIHYDYENTVHNEIISVTEHAECIRDFFYGSR